MGEDQEGRSRTGAGRRPPGGKAAQAPRARKRTRPADAERARLAAIANSSFDAITGADLDGITTYWNAAAERMYGYTAEEALGRHISLIVPDSRRGEVEGILVRLRRGEPVPPFETVRRRKDGTELMVSLAVSPMLGPDGTIIGASAIARDITERVCAEASLRENEERLRLALDAGRLGEWDWDLKTDTATQSLRTYQVYGYDAPLPEFTYATFMRHVLPEDREAVDRSIQQALRTWEPLHMECRIRRVDGELRWIEVLGRRLRDADRMIGVIQDITERKRAEEGRELLIHELNHRVKNMLAVVRAMFKQSRRLSPSPEAFEDAFTGRIGAIAAAHDMLTRDHWHASALADVAAQVLEPFRQRAGGIVIQGGDKVMLRPQAATTLAMVLHELATNAAKYGALSVARGRVELIWTAEATDTGPVLDLRWRETGGPPVVEPRQQGFGSHLIERAVAYELDGTAELSFAPGGVQCRLRIPLTPEVGSRAP